MLHYVQWYGYYYGGLEQRLPTWHSIEKGTLITARFMLVMYKRYVRYLEDYMLAHCLE